MKPQNKLILSIFVVLSLMTLSAFLAVYFTPEKVIKPTYTHNDSIENVRIDSVKGIYQQVIDSLTKSVKSRKVKTTYYKKIADSLESKADTSCYPVIAAKNRQIAELDSTCNDLDKEAQNYSNLLYLERQQKELEIKRNATLSFKLDSTIISCRDSLNTQEIKHKKELNKQKTNTVFYKITTTIAAALGIYGIIAK